jgi:hypothetical protein
LYNKEDSSTYLAGISPTVSPTASMIGPDGIFSPSGTILENKTSGKMTNKKYGINEGIDSPENKFAMIQDALS